MPGVVQGVLGSSWSIGQIWWALVIGVLLFDSFLPALFRGVPRCANKADLSRVPKSLLVLGFPVRKPVCNL